MIPGGGSHGGSASRLEGGGAREGGVSEFPGASAQRSPKIVSSSAGNTARSFFFVVWNEFLFDLESFLVENAIFCVLNSIRV